MKNFIWIFFISFSLAFVQHKEYSPTVADYQEKISYFESVSKNLFQEKTWEKILLQSKYEKKELSWDMLSDYQKQMFCFAMGNRTLNSFLKIEDHWKEELRKFENPNHKLINSSESRPATKQEVKKFLEEIQKMRRVFAIDYDNYAQNFFAKYNSELTKEEIESYTKKIQDAKR